MRKNPGIAAALILIRPKTVPGIITTVVGGTVESKNLAALSDAFVKCYGKSVLDKELKNNQMLSVIGDEFIVTYVREDM